MAFSKLYITRCFASLGQGTLGLKGGPYGMGGWVGVIHQLLPDRRDAATVATPFNITDPISTTNLKGCGYAAHSGPLAAQTISGNIDLVMGVQESAAGADFNFCLHVWVTVGDTNAVRGTLVNQYTEVAGVNEWPTVAQGWGLAAPVAMSSVACQDGDRLVVEIGYISRNSVSTSFTGSFYYGQFNATSDLSVGDTNVTTKGGFLSFSNPISTLAPPTNDDWASATVISSLPYTATQNIEWATDEVTDPTVVVGVSSLRPYNAVWFSFTPATTDFYVLDTEGSPGFIDPMIGIYTGSPGSFVQVAADDDGGTGILAARGLTLTSGTAYYILVAAKNGAGGNIQFNVAVGTPSPASAPVLSGSNMGSNQNHLTWTNTVLSGGSTELQRCSGVGCSAYASISVGGFSYEDYGVSQGLTYSYRVRSTHPLLGDSAWSNVVTIAIPAASGFTTGFSSRYFRFAKSGSTGTQIVSGVGFRGKALLLWTTYASGPTSSAEMSLGLTDGVTQAVRAINLPAGETSSPTTGRSSQGELLEYIALRTIPVAFGDGPFDPVHQTTTVPSTPPWVSARASFTGFNSDGFTLNWSINDGDSSSIMHAIVIGGGIQVAVAAVKVNVAAPNSISVTGVGFQPDSYIVMGGTFDEFNTGSTDIGGPPVGSMHGFGFSNASENVCGWALGHGRPYTGQYGSSQHVDRVVSIRTANLNNTNELVAGRITASNPDGFTFARTVGDLTHQPYQYVLCIRGAKFKLGSFATPVNTTSIVSIPTGFNPDTMLFQTGGTINNATTLGLSMVVGAWQRAVDAAPVDAGGTSIRGTFGGLLTDTARSSYSGRVLEYTTVQGSIISTSSTTASFRLTAANGGSFDVLYMAIGPYVDHIDPTPEPPAPFPIPPPEVCCTGGSGTPTTPDPDVPDPDPYKPPPDMLIVCEGEGVVPIGGAGIVGSDDWVM